MNVTRKLTQRDIDFIQNNYTKYGPTELSRLLDTDAPLVAYYINKFKNKDADLKEIEEMKVRKANFKRPDSVYSNINWNDPNATIINANYKSSY
jgi:hypothetical protein